MGVGGRAGGRAGRCGCGCGVGVGVGGRGGGGGVGSLFKVGVPRKMLWFSVGFPLKTEQQGVP